MKTDKEFDEAMKEMFDQIGKLQGWQLGVRIFGYSSILLPSLAGFTILLLSHFDIISSLEDTSAFFRVAALGGCVIFLPDLIGVVVGLFRNR